MRVSGSGMTGPRVDIIRGPPEQLTDEVLGAFMYGVQRSETGDPRVLATGLQAVDGMPATELWRAPGPATPGIDGHIRFSAHPEFLFGILELDERKFRGVSDAAESAYRWMREFQGRHPQRHLLRIWNFLDSINEGEGDRERYRQFCVGRARGLGDLPSEELPAGTAVGRPRAAGSMQLCWLAGRAPGRSIENPRQVRAYRYPRDYGPSPPAFARAMRLETGELMGSGTSSIVGHESRHGGDLEAQVDETLENLLALHRAGGSAGTPTGVKVYLRERAGGSGVATKIRAVLSDAAQPLLIEADICRRELLVEIECLWT